MPKKTKDVENTDTPYDAELEKHVDEMLAPEPATKSKKIQITHDADTAEVSAPTPVEVASEPLPAPEEQVTAPLVQDAPIPKEPVKISVLHQEGEAPEAPAPEEPKIIKRKKIVPITHEAEETPAEVASEELEPVDVLGLPIAELEKMAAAKEASEVAEPLPIEATAEPTPVATKPIPRLFPDGGSNAPKLPEDEYSDAKTERLVDDIVAKESDALLAAEDAKRGTFAAPTKTKSKKSKRSGHSPFLKLVRNVLVLAIFCGIAAAAAIPQSRYYILNTAGVRSSASVTVLDDSSQQPLKNATVKLANQTAQTNEQGVATIHGLKLGPTSLSIEKRAFAPIQKNIVIGWGSNPLPSFDLSPTGSQYTIKINDYLSGAPIGTATAVSEYADANADDKGLIKLTLDKNSKDTVDITIKNEGYRDEHLALTRDSKNEVVVNMVPVRQHVFISKRAGTYNLYRVDLDGKNEQQVLAGTGSERPDMVLVPSPTQNIVALVSTRDNAKNAQGFVLSTLNIVDINSGAITKVSQSEQIRIIGWHDGRIAYIQIASGTSATDSNRQRLMSYDYAKRDNKQLASTNAFNEVLAAGDSIYYAPTGSEGDASGSFTRIKFDGTDKKQILIGETWNAFRSDYEHILLSVPGAWYQHTLGSATATKLDAQPASTASRIYLDSPDGKHALWLNNTGGKGQLTSYDIAAKKDVVLATVEGARQPIAWLDARTAIFRLVSGGVTADYAVSLSGGEPKKVHDVTATGDADSWYHYSN